MSGLRLMLPDIKHLNEPSSACPVAADSILRPLHSANLSGCIPLITFAHAQLARSFHDSPAPRKCQS